MRTGNLFVKHKMFDTATFFHNNITRKHILNHFQCFDISTVSINGHTSTPDGFYLDIIMTSSNSEIATFDGFYVTSTFVISTSTKWIKVTWIKACFNVLCVGAAGFEWRRIYSAKQRPFLCITCGNSKKRGKEKKSKREEQTGCKGKLHLKRKSMYTFEWLDWSFEQTILSQLETDPSMQSVFH